jgi:predicted HTH transcriptional regulator
LEETRYCEFKEVTSDDPIPAIKRTIEEYVVAFLNSDGGRILWGIRDADRVVTGVRANYRQRDVIRRLITDKVMRIQPSISPSALRIHFHPIFKESSTVKELHVIEVEVPKSLTNFLYFTNDNKVYVKTEAGKKRLSGPEIQDEIIRRLQK